MESNVPLDSEIHALEITSESRDYLLTTAKWGRFIAIVGFVFMGLFLLIMIFAGSAFSMAMSELESDPAMSPLPAGVGTGIMTAYMIFIFAITLVPLYYLYTFSTKTIRAVKSSNTEDLTDGLKNLKSLFKFYGIFMAIMVGLYGLIFIGGMLGALLAG